jgi:hypothetical protein
VPYRFTGFTPFNGSPASRPGSLEFSFENGNEDMLENKYITLLNCYPEITHLLQKDTIRAGITKYWLPHTGSCNLSASALHAFAPGALAVSIFI